MEDEKENRTHPRLERGIRQRMSEQSDDMSVQKKIEYYIASVTMPSGEKNENPGLPDAQIYQSVSQKLKNGDALSATEESELQQNSMRAYERAKALEQENEAFLQKLRDCKTQDEVQRTETAQLESIISAYRLVENNAEIPIEQKREYTLSKDAKLSAIHNVAQKFMESDSYKKLPPDTKITPLDEDDPQAAEEPESPEERESKWRRAQSSYESLRQSIDEQDALESSGKVPFDTKG